MEGRGCSTTLDKDEYDYEGGGRGGEGGIFLLKLA